MDAEIAAMAKITEALKDLDESACKRVLQWAASKYSVSISIPSSEINEGQGDSASDNNLGRHEQPDQFETFAELFSQASPSIHSDKVLVAGYWHQVIQGKKQLTSAELNKDLADLGHRIKNISEKFDSLKTKKPQLALQLKKSGTAKQARKKYKLSKAGIDRVEEMLSSRTDSQYD